MKPTNEKILLQLSSGQGSIECELAVMKLLEALCAEDPDAEVAGRTAGSRDGCLKSARILCNGRFAGLDGSVQWICRSPFRPHHKRKNWFVDVSVCEVADDEAFDERQVRYETFRSPGKGGQHVNTTDSGVRAVYTPTGDTAISTDERSQAQNKRTAILRLKAVIGVRAAEDRERVNTDNWLEHTRLVRGNPVRVYEGMDFNLVKENVVL